MYDDIFRKRPSQHDETVIETYGAGRGTIAPLRPGTGNGKTGVCNPERRSRSGQHFAQLAFGRATEPCAQGSRNIVTRRRRYAEDTVGHTRTRTRYGTNWKFCASVQNSPASDYIGKNCLRRLVLRQFAPDPRLFFPQKPLDFPHGKTQRRAHDHPPAANDDGNGFPSAAFQLVVHQRCGKSIFCPVRI